MGWLRRFLKSDWAKQWKYPLHKAVLRSDMATAAKLIKWGCDVNKYDDLGMTPLFWAVMRGDTPTTRLLLENGADPNLRSMVGDSVLWQAEDDFFFFEIAELLKQHGAHK